MTQSRFPDAPANIAALPVDKRGFPVPYFVAWQDGEPVFPAADGEKMAECFKRDLCWVCGQPNVAERVYVVGPMCIVNRISSEPPCHRACAEFAAKHCPFLANPRMGRVPQENYGGVEAAGEMICRNPGVTALAETRGPTKPVRVHNGVLFSVNPIVKVDWWAEGQRATRQQVEDALESGLPELKRIAVAEGFAAQVALQQNVKLVRNQYLPESEVA